MNKELALPPAAEIESHLSILTAQLEWFATDARQEGFDHETLGQGKVSPSISTDPTEIYGFWNHVLSGNGIAKARRLHSETEYTGRDNSEDIRTSQIDTIANVNTWLLPGNEKLPQHQQACEAFLQATTAFDWIQDPNRVNQLSEIAYRVGNCFSMLHDGEPLMGFNNFERIRR